MRPRQAAASVPSISIGRARAQRPVAGHLVIVLLLITGLLNFPSVCDCGAELPHAHSLFILADHDHAPNGDIVVYPMQQALDASAQAVASAPSPNAPVIQGPSDEFIGGGPIGLSLSTFGPTGTLGSRTTLGWPVRGLNLGVSVAPESPPPRPIV